MDENKNLYETIMVLHPELTEEDVEAGIQHIVQLLETHGGEVLRVDRGGKRRLAYLVQKQRYGYYNLVHFRATPEVLPDLERSYRLNERVIRYLTVRFEKEEQLMGFTRLVDDEGRDDREDRRYGGRRGGQARATGRRPASEAAAPVAVAESPATDAVIQKAMVASEDARASQTAAEVTLEIVEETG
ncbi:hypothetical protein NKDENANG_03115 [Candidatus Entotheonellaceae bacterium PAL068K]